MPFSPPIHRPPHARGGDPRPSPRQRGYDSAWERLRAAVIAEVGACQHPGCGSTHRLNVDHVVAVVRAPHRRLDRSNLVVLCAAHHSAKTVREDGGFGRPLTRGSR